MATHDPDQLRQEAAAFRRAGDDVLADSLDALADTEDA